MFGINDADPIGPIAKIFNDGIRFDAGNGEVGYSYRGLEAIVDPVTKRVVTFRPEKIGAVDV